jgi:aspartate/methionine/tyrosine aminotransferase
MVGAVRIVPVPGAVRPRCPSRRDVRSPSRAFSLQVPRAAQNDDATYTPTERVANLQSEGAYAVLAKATALEREGRNIVHLEIGQPGFSTPQHVLDAGIEAIQSGKTKYAAPDGSPSLREAIATYVSETRNVQVSPDEVIVGPGAKPGLFFPTLAIVNPSDTVIYPEPGFPTYRAMVEVAGGVPVPAPLRDDGKSFDMNALTKLIETKKPKLLVINSPGNPTGGVMPKEDVEQIVDLAIEHDFFILTDEIYSRLVYDNTKAHSPFSIPKARSRVILVDGFSKTYCMTGWRLGWAVMPRHIARKVELLAVHSYGCVASFTQEAGVAALTGPQNEVEEIKNEYKLRRDYVVGELNSIPGVHCPKPEGAFYVFPDVSSYGKTSQEISDDLLTQETGGVAVLPGTDFGKNGEGKIRISYVGEMETLKEGMGRIKKYFEQLE